ncbi:MAG: hypothetical protein HZC11_06365 [Nitrospirae bacterium]|nr:hypothetical protein [Nitrospirota bacterium]
MQKKFFLFLVFLSVFFLPALFLHGSSVHAAGYKVYGAGYNYPAPLFRASLSLSAEKSSLSAGWVKYYYTRSRLSLISTAISGLSVIGSTATITGSGAVNGIAGYTFTATIIDGSPDKMSIEVRKPDGNLYFKDPSDGSARTIAGGNFIIEFISSTWTGSGADNFASNPANWSGNVVPSEGDNVVFDNTSTKDCIWDLNMTIASLNINSGYTGTVALSSNLTVTGDITIASGTFNGSASTITVKGNWSNSGIFTPSASTVILNGANQTISGSTTFYNLFKVATSADTLYFQSSSTQKILNSLILNGADGGLLSLRGTSQGGYWYLDAQGTRSIVFADIMDLYNINSTKIITAYSVNSGNNINISFGGSECARLGDKLVIKDFWTKTC